MIKLLNFSPGRMALIKTHSKASSYTPDNSNIYPYSALELKPYNTNNASLVPNHEMPKPGPILTPDGIQEHEIEWILNAQPRGCGYQYFV